MKRGLWPAGLLLALTPLWALAQSSDSDPGAAAVNAPPPPLLPALNRGSPAHANPPELPAPVPRPDTAGDAPLPPKATSSDELRPGVTIRAGDDGQVVEEYAVNGRIYMVRVTPAVGPVYYLFDVDGDGEMETREFESDPGIKPVHWKILEWD